MSQEVHVVRNQHGHYWGKSKAWVDGRDTRAVARVKHRDEGVNLLFELSTKDIELRGDVIAVTVNERGEPVLEISEVPLPEVTAKPVDETPTTAGNTESHNVVKAPDSKTHPE